MPEAKLVILNGPYDGAVHGVALGTTWIGASSEANVRISCDPAFPAGGIKLTMDEKGVQYEDCQTQTVQKVIPGAVFTVGQTQLVIQLEKSPQENHSVRGQADDERAVT